MPDPLSKGAVLAAAAASAVLTGVLTGLVRRYALDRSLLDHPNARSSHAVPTPRGGGLAIAGTTLSFVGLAWAAGYLERRTAVAILAGGIVIAGVGWADDHLSLSPLLRGSVHVIIAVLAAAWLGLAPLGADAAAPAAGWLAWGLGALFIAWMINLFNFMDGIDGLAAAEAAMVGGIGGLLLMLGGAPDLALVAWIVAGSCVGFLFWNWQPARIFMGDVGSGLLGFLFAVLALASHVRGAMSVGAWAILLGVFLMDATLTLLRRMWRREAWYQSHRHHAYQRLVQAGASHERVTLGVIGLNTLLGGAAWLAWRRPVSWAWTGSGALLVLLAVYLAVERVLPMRRSEPPRIAEGEPIR